MLWLLPKITIHLSRCNFVLLICQSLYGQAIVNDQRIRGCSINHARTTGLSWLLIKVRLDLLAKYREAIMLVEPRRQLTNALQLT
jgi:hypothetical protein